LAGGRSSRLGGRDKALTRLGRGRTLIEEVVGRLGFIEEIIVATSDEKRASIYGRVTGVKVVVDSYPGILGGILSGLRGLSAEEVFITGVDMPLLSKRIILRQFECLYGFEAVVPRHSNGFLEPLHSVVRRIPALGVLERLGSSEIVRVARLFKGMNTRYLPVSELRALDPQLESFTNVNDRETLERVLKRISDS